mgnify:CR=1 FL=1
MQEIEDKDTRYFLEIELETLEIIRVGFEQKHSLDKGQQMNPGIHRLFLSNGQYKKFVSRCKTELQSVLDT